MRRQRWQRPVEESTPWPEGADVSLLRDLTHALAQAEHPRDALQFALDRFCPAVHATVGAVFLLDPVGEAMQLAAAHGWPASARPWLGALRVEVGRGPSGEAVAERRVIEIADVLGDPALAEWHAVATELGFHAVMAVPLLTHDGIHGAVTVYFPDAGTVPVRTRALVRACADLMAAMVERGALAERLRRAEAAVAGMDAL